MVNYFYSQVLTALTDLAGTSTVTFGKEICRAPAPYDEKRELIAAIKDAFRNEGNRWEVLAHFDVPQSYKKATMPGSGCQSTEDVLLFSPDACSCVLMAGGATKAALFTADFVAGTDEPGTTRKLCVTVVLPNSCGDSPVEALDRTRGVVLGLLDRDLTNGGAFFETDYAEAFPWIALLRFSSFPSASVGTGS